MVNVYTSVVLCIVAMFNLILWLQMFRRSLLRPFSGYKCVEAAGLFETLVTRTGL
jgi:hypothetical protein